MAEKTREKYTKKCPCTGCTQTFTADDELGARIKLIAHIAAKHTKIRISK